MKRILGTKINMTQAFTEKGAVVPVTVISAGPLKVIKLKTKEKDGYDSVQVGYGERKLKNINKPQHKQGNFRFVREFRFSESEKATMPMVGDEIKVSSFAVGDVVDVSSISKGKGFQGVVKRHGFSGGSRTHGQKHSEREPGSIGGGGRAGGRVAKGMRMAGRMGGGKITVKNLSIVGIDAENNQIFIKGAIPGVRGALVTIIG